MGFENECKIWINNSPEINLCKVNTESFDEIDFLLEHRGISFALDCKEKKSRSRQ